jgi:hypothetical protein
MHIQLVEAAVQILHLQGRIRMTHRGPRGRPQGGLDPAAREEADGGERGCEETGI